MTVTDFRYAFDVSHHVLPGGIFDRDYMDKVRAYTRSCKFRLQPTAVEQSQHPGLFACDGSTILMPFVLLSFSANVLKRCMMNKTVVWETDMITSGIQQRIKQLGRLLMHFTSLLLVNVRGLSELMILSLYVWTHRPGYHHTISVNFIVVKPMVKIENSSGLSQYVHIFMSLHSVLLDD